MTQYDVVIVGAGASGLMCAATAGKRGLKVLVIEGSNKVGKKILMSGGGRCNFTNLDVTPKNYLSHNPHFCISALKRYTQWDFIALVNLYEIPYVERDLGKLFCLNSAKDILNMLMSECEKTGGVEIVTHTKVQSVQALQQGFALQAITDAGAGTSNIALSCGSLVISSGGLSIPTMGATGWGYEIARQFGHHVYPTRAGLVPFTFSDAFKDTSEALSGLAMDVNLSSDAAAFNEAVLFTHRGLSGPASLQLSNYWELGQAITLDLFPADSQDDLLNWLQSKKQTQSKSLLRTLLTERLAKSLAWQLQMALWAKYAETPVGQIPDAALQTLAKDLKHWTQKPSGTEGYRTAEVTLGGVDTTELSSKTMQSNKQAGLYFIGEVVDVTGWLGGYNFQWAWASGHAAGMSVGS